MKGLEGVHGHNVGSYVFEMKLYDIARERIFNNDQSMTDEEMLEEMYDWSDEEGWGELLSEPIDGVNYERTFPCPNNGDDWSYIEIVKYPKETLIDKVLDRIKEDVNHEDMTAIDELVRYIPTRNLENFLAED